jgi:uncharacterized protein
MPQYKGLELFVDATDTEHRGYYEAAGRKALVVQRCDTCQKLRGSIGAACPFCMSTNWSWSEVSGKGTIYSYIIVAHPLHPAFAEWVPYPIVLVELDEQRCVPWRGGNDGSTVSVRLRTNLVRRDDLSKPEAEENVRIGLRVQACFVELDGGLAVPQFCLAD